MNKHIHIGTYTTGTLAHILMSIRIVCISFVEDREQINFEATPQRLKALSLLA